MEKFVKNNYNKYSGFFNVTDSYKNRVYENINFGKDISKSTDLELILERINKKYVIPKYILEFAKSKNLKFIHSKNPNPKGLTVITTSDGKNYEVHIDCSNLLFQNKATGKLECRDDNTLLHYIYTALFSYSISRYPNMFLRKGEFISYGTKIYSNLFTYVYEYLYKLSSNLYSFDKLKFLSCLFFQHNILGLDLKESVRNSKKISGFANEKVIEAMMMRISDEMISTSFMNFFNGIKDVIEIRKEVEFALFVEKFMSLYGEGTQFSLELITPFVDNITAISDNIFINNKNTVEKIGEFPNISKFSASIKSVLNEIYS